MLTTIAAGRVFDFSHVVGRGGGSGMGFSRAVALALGEGDTVYVLNRGAEQIKDVPWNRSYVGARVGKFTIGPVPGDEEFVADMATPEMALGNSYGPLALRLIARKTCTSPTSGSTVSPSSIRTATSCAIGAQLEAVMVSSMPFGDRH